MSVTIGGQTIEIKQEVEETELKDEPDYPTDDDDVQRAIESLKEIKDEQLQEFLDDGILENFDVVDIWKGNEDSKLEGQNESPNKEKEYRRSRERHRRDRDRPKRDDKKREETRRDPLKSSKDIERDKIRTKRDNEIKLLAEKEKAIKHLLDSDNVVPPGTEEEAIESIAEKQNQERAQIRNRRSRERRRSLERVRKSPSRRSSNRFRGSPVRRRSPLIISPERRKSPYRRSPRYFDRSSMLSPERRRSPLRSWERRSSIDRRWSPDRHRRRIDVHERRRSRSRERQRSRSRTRSRTRSRSPDRLRRRSSRSPLERRYSPRRRTRSRSRSPDRRVRKRSPFLNELARQLTKDAMMSSSHVAGGGFLPTMEASTSSMTTQQMYQDPQQRGGLPSHPPYMHPPVPHAPMQSPGIPLPPPSVPPPSFVPYEPPPPPPMNFDSMAMHSGLPPADYASGPVMYNQANQPGPPPGQMPHRPPLLPPPTPVPPPQPVPPPTPMDHAPISTYPPHTSPHQLSTRQHLEPLNKYAEPSSSYSGRSSKSPYAYRAEREERLKTPEPPVISSTKNFEKTSLSSLLEASVSAKDSSSSSALYTGFRPEIYRRCEQALRELQTEDPRLEMTGRFFFDPAKEEVKKDMDDQRSNSVLLYKNKACWGENESHQSQSQTQSRLQSPHSLMPSTHQKLCQTELRIQESKCIQVSVMTADFSMQVCPSDLDEAAKEDKRPIMDRLDWNVRESYDYSSKHHRETDDLRWSLSNSSRKASWTRGGSPSLRRSHDEEYYVDRASPQRDSRSRERDRERSGERHRERDSYSGHRGSPRDRYSRDSYSPVYSRPMDETDNYHEGRSDYSRGESPLGLDKSDDEIEPREHNFHRGSEWIGRGKPSRGRSGSLIKGYIRGKYSGRPFRGRGGYRGKY